MWPPIEVRYCLYTRLPRWRTTGTKLFRPVSRGSPNPETTHRVHEFRTLTQEIIVPNAKLAIVVSIDKNIYYNQKRS
jgi:hypothetical protein